jgi:DNA-binding MarR family transcriptional regulator
MPARPLAEQSQRIVDLLPIVIKNLRIGGLLDNVRPGLSLSQVLALLALERASAGGASMRELAEELGVTVPTTTGLVDRLAREGLVERRPHTTDRRVVLVLPTAEGRDAVRRSAAYLAEVMAAVLSDVDEGERESLVRAVERVRDLSGRIRDEQRRIASSA